MKNDLTHLLSKSIEKRQRLFNVTNAVRLVNGIGDNLQGLIIERYNRHVVIQLLDKRWQESTQALADFFRLECGAVYCIIKDRSANAAATSDAFTSQVFFGTDSRTIVTEYGKEFHVDLNDGLNSGLFLDMRKNRHMVANLASKKRVLNCFAYTCSFGVHCKAAGAATVTNVDISKRYLECGQANYELNKLTIGEKEFVKADTQFYLERAVAKNSRFDLIVLDPPSFSRYEKKIFSVKKDLGNLVTLALRSLESRGYLYVSTNFSGLTPKQLETIVRSSDKDGRVKQCAHFGQDNDFVGSGKSPESYLAAILINV